MKVTKYEKTATFKPVELTITFESSEEIAAFRDLMGFEITIPDWLVDHHGVLQSRKKILSAQMADIFNELNR